MPTSHLMPLLASITTVLQSMTERERVAFALVALMFSVLVIIVCLLRFAAKDKQDLRDRISTIATQVTERANTLHAELAGARADNRSLLTALSEARTKSSAKMLALRNENESLRAGIAGHVSDVELLEGKLRKTEDFLSGVVENKEALEKRLAEQEALTLKMAAEATGWMERHADLAKCAKASADASVTGDEQAILSLSFCAAWGTVAEGVHLTALEKGWWSINAPASAALRKMAVGEPDAGLAQWADKVAAMLDRKNDGEMLMLMVCEVAEAMEGIRHGNPPDDKIPEFSSVEAELADVVIRIMDYSTQRGFRIAEAIMAKTAMNKTREHMHGGKLC